MIAALRSWLNRPRFRDLFASRDRSRPTSSALEQRRAVCAERLADAETRGDTRAIGFWSMALRQATNDALRAAA